MCQIQAFIVTLLHQDTSANHPRIKSSYKKKRKWSIAMFVLAWRQFLSPAEVKDILIICDSQNHTERGISHLNKEKKNKIIVENNWICDEKSAYN